MNKTLLIVMMLLIFIPARQEQKEIEMAKNNQVMKEEQGNKQTYNSQANFQTPTSGTAFKKPEDPPAWLSGGGAGAGGGVVMPQPMIPMSDEEIGTAMKNEIMGYQGFQTPTSSAQVGAVSRPGNNPFSNAAGANNGVVISNPPAWAPQNPYPRPVQPNNDDEMYAGNTGMAGYYAPFNAARNPATMIPTYQGQPVNNSFSDTLRGLTPPAPVVRGNGPSLSDTLRTLASGAWTPATIPWANRPTNNNGGGFSFGSKYRGWGGGGGGWNDGGGYGGYGDAPAWWNPNMGLFSWKFG